jgi:hypothetical protein
LEEGLFQKFRFIALDEASPIWMSGLEFFRGADEITVGSKMCLSHLIISPVKYNKGFLIVYVVGPFHAGYDVPNLFGGGKEFLYKSLEALQV